MNNQDVAIIRRPRQGNLNTRDQLEERRRNLELYLDLLVHAAGCVSKRCTSRNCRTMKAHLKHRAQCQVKASGGCRRCKRLWGLVWLHARKCKARHCFVPKCRAIREYNQIRQVLERCKTEASFDFCKYFSSRPLESDFIDLKEKTVAASKMLRPYYYSYTYRRAEKRLLSHKSTLFSQPQQQKEGSILPALPKELEVKIRAMALLCGDHPIRATRIPAPLPPANVYDPIQAFCSPVPMYQPQMNSTELSIEDAQHILQVLRTAPHCST